MASKAVLIDTHIFLWLIEGTSLSRTAHKAISEATNGRKIGISAISVWEIMMLIWKKRVQVRIPIKQWFDQAMTAPGITIIPLSPEILIESCLLPEYHYNDPADRMIIATARIKNIPLVTRDQRILEYGNSGYFSGIKG